MAVRNRRLILLAVVAMLAVTLATAPALAHEGHDGHEPEEETGPSIWPYLFGIGSVAAAGSLLAGYRFDVPREFAVGFAAGGLALAAGAAIVWIV
jgi:hydrogenase/urease accessory protein HupE